MQEIHVSIHGDDDNPGTREEPVKTMTRAWAILQARGPIRLAPVPPKAVPPEQASGR